ncbi:iron-sulfur cluster insertion protein ErpA [Candidatus Finniella inopinata]|uniref:Iron-sulfur cluster insertion protein ErpA n=1 Tax=Candidatus Finniella inopinata TaxID=1696036 RepID=A0A4V2DZK7_9PROT|nr:iron-sulfur cluster insertion protein ErpA [Candidatus Finniella inopinata]RZI45397.1 iron-sulfur cluster insertion protein ErpA [Candidatus Finniella inopinata]
MLKLTENAIKRLNHLIASKPCDQTTHLRVSVSGGGCSGFQYHFSLDTAVHADDQIFPTEGSTVVVDNASLNLIEGSIIDYVEDLSSASFVMKNPNAVSGCGCGNSFSI